MQFPSQSDQRLSCVEVPAAKSIPGLVEDARAGLLSAPRSLPPKYFYDEIGSRLFERICETPEYYPSRTEESLLIEHAAGIIAASRPDHLIELGSGSARKTRHLLDACGRVGQICVYWPLDVCQSMLLDSGSALVADYPWLTVRALVGDYNGGLSHLPLPAAGRRLVAFLGGTIGNFEGPEAVGILSEVAGMLRSGDCLLLGADRVKNPRTLRAAYDDAAGVTARFNKNVLRVLNRELDANFPVDDYRHRAVFNEVESRIEMRLQAGRGHRVRLGELDAEIEIGEGEEILTEVSHKFTPDSLAAVLSRAGLRERAHFEAPGGAYSLVLATPR